MTNPFRRLEREDKVRIGLCLGLTLLISLLHYATSLQYLELHESFEHLYYVPILLIAFWYGTLAGVALALLTSAIYLVHILRDLAEYTLADPLTHLFLYNLMALIVGLLSDKAHRNLEHFKNASAELRAANEELKSTSESLRRSERLVALGQLSAGIAHEIRNPLGSIKGAVEILTSEIGAGHPKAEFVTIVRQEIARINRLIEDFLHFARPSKPEIRSVRMSDLVSSAVRLVEGHASRQGITMTCIGEDHALAVDENQMRQVLLNLLLNAIDAMPEGGRLGISFQRQAETETSTLQISDTGPSGESVNLERIFDPFFTTKPQGTGLGLSISDRLVRNHGGRLSARHNAEKGLTLQIELPSQS